MIAEFTKKLQQAFPDKRVEVSLDIAEFIVRYAISIDGKIMRLKWDVELAQTMKAYHGLSVEEAIFEGLVSEIKEELTRV